MRYRRHKYNAKKTVIDGITFDSKAEAKRYTELKLLERAGLISKLKLQPRYNLMPSYTNGKGQKIRAIDYIADFEYLDTETNRVVIEDVKGKKTAVYNIKKKLFEKRYKPQTIKEIKE
ncbi:MAG TPA: DUF1064 domain-containing protein [Dysgonamonadaceae bacterium]|nr:DUF1064 domain-containing protein [Dysgonamonadaceae bacterium]